MPKHLFILIAITVLSCGKKKNPSTGWNYNEAQTDAYYQVKIPDNSNLKGDKQLKIILEPNKRQHFLNFGMFNTENDWKIYDWLSYHGSDSQLPKPLIEVHFTAAQESVINISSLDTGKYMVSYTEIAESCNFVLAIQ